MSFYLVSFLRKERKYCGNISVVGLGGDEDGGVLTTVFIVRVDSSRVPREELADCCDVAVASSYPDVW